MSLWLGRRVETVECDDAVGAGATAVLLDVRNQDEWDAGHAPNAEFCPLPELETMRFKLPMNRQIICICRSGVRSEKAAAELINMGFNAVNMTGGMKAWAAAGHPVVTDDGSPGTVI
jgi:rhodanese-related sulfurtransferase